MQRETWDGAPVSPEKPYGASVVVYTRGDRGPLFLVLHRAYAGPDYEGEWAWTPPSGARFPGEAIASCARRELKEETGLELSLLEVACGSESWPVYAAKAPPGARIRLSVEHDRFLWVEGAEATRQCTPDEVGDQIRCVLEWLDSSSAQAI